MVQFEVLSGKTAGKSFVARRFPVRIGRSTSAEVALEEEGVWAEHLEVSLDASGSFVMHVATHALATLNGQPAESGRLRNGDTLEIGSVRLRFWLSPPRQSRLWSWEAAVWFALVCVTVFQAALLGWLVR